MFQNHLLNDRQRAFLMISLLEGGGESSKIIPFLPLQEQGVISRVFEQLHSKTKEVKKQIITDELRRLSVESRRVALAEIHPDWIFSALKGESPRMIATILRHLPGHHVSHILNKLPHATLEHMPPLSETFSLDSELVQVLRKRFEESFFGVSTAGAKKDPFRAIPLFSPVKLELFFRELGFHEVSMAFATLNENTINLVLRRLPPRDAVLLKGHIEKRGSVPEERLKQAQTHLLSLDLEKGVPESLIIETGFFVYSKALLSDDEPGARVIAQKFSSIIGSALGRYMERNLPSNSEKTVMRYRKEITAVVSGIQEEKR